MKRVAFRGRLFLILLAFALVPSILLSVAWAGTSLWGLRLVGATAAWDSVAATGQQAVNAARSAPLAPADSVAIAEHERTLQTSLLRARQAGFVFERAAYAFAGLAVFVLLVFAALASGVAGHLSRNIGRPLQELVRWTEHIGRGDPLPTDPPSRGAPEFEVLRTRMREMAAELEAGRAQAVEAERAAALRESARQVAHELKNPLTPIRFAVTRLRANAPPQLAEVVDVLDVETQRLEDMARAFGQFGRLPEGPRAPVDLGELAQYTARAVLPADRAGSVTVAPDLPAVRGHYDALARALTNIVLNAVDACRAGGQVSLRVHPARMRERDFIAVEVSDTGCGIPPEQLERIWEPYVTNKPGGTGLGLAIVRQTIAAHDGFVAAESAPGRGTSIRLYLPVTTAAEAATALAH